MSSHHLVPRPPLACMLLAASLLLAESARAQPEPAGHVAAIRITSQPAAATLGAEYRPTRLWPVGDAVRTIEAALDKRCGQLAFAETPLRDVVATIAEQGGLTIALDHKAFEDAGLDAETPVTGRCAGVSLRSALRAVLHDIDLATIIRHDRLLVTTVAEAHEHPARTFYPVLPGEDLEEVVALIERTIAPHTWDTVGGTGTVAPAPASLGWGLVVTQSDDVQEQVEALLRECDRMAWEFPGPAGGRAKHLRGYEIDDDVTRSQLAEELVDLCNQALPDGGDPDARVLEIGRSLVVQSRSRPFHMMAAQLVAAVTGVVELLEVELPEDEPPRQPERPEST
jgi:hypothetical protein